MKLMLSLLSVHIVAKVAYASNYGSNIALLNEVHQNPWAYIPRTKHQALSNCDSILYSYPKESFEGAYKFMFATTNSIIKK